MLRRMMRIDTAVDVFELCLVALCEQHSPNRQALTRLMRATRHPMQEPLLTRCLQDWKRSAFPNHRCVDMAGNGVRRTLASTTHKQHALLLSAYTFQQQMVQLSLLVLRSAAGQSLICCVERPECKNELCRTMMMVLMKKIVLIMLMLMMTRRG